MILGHPLGADILRAWSSAPRSHSVTAVCGYCHGEGTVPRRGCEEQCPMCHGSGQRPVCSCGQIHDSLKEWEHVHGEAM